MSQITIIIVNYQGASDVIECIQSIRVLSSQPQHIVVVDNDSNDGSIEELSQHKENLKFHLIAAGKNNGFAAGCNIGIRYALGLGVEYMGLINPDTILTQDDFFKKMQHALMEKEYGIIGSFVLSIKDRTIEFGGGKIIPWILFPKIDSYGKSYDGGKTYDLRAVDFVTGSSLFFDVCILDKLGYMREEFFLYFEETDWCMRAKRCGIKIGVLQDIYLLHKTSSSVGFRSLLYMRCMIKNYARFAIRFARWYELPGWLLIYIGFWIPGQVVGYLFRKFF